MRKIRWNKEQFKSRLMGLTDRFGYGGVLRERKESEITLKFLDGKLGEQEWAC